MTEAIITAVYPSTRNQKIVHTTVTLSAFEDTVPTMRIIAIITMAIERQSMARMLSFCDVGIIEEPSMVIGMLMTKSVLIKGHAWVVIEHTQDIRNDIQSGE